MDAEKQKCEWYGRYPKSDRVGMLIGNLDWLSEQYLIDAEALREEAA